MSKRRRTFKIKHYPQETRGGITYVHTPPDNLYALGDALWFAKHPGETMYLRKAAPGEFVCVKLPDDMLLSDIRYVLVRRLPGNLQQMRIPLRIEDMEHLRNPGFFGYAASGE
jgi:hypothetical protein